MRTSTPVARHRRTTASVAWGSVVTPHVPHGDVRRSGDHRELDGQRGAAVLAIVVFHVYQFANVDHFLYFGTPAYTVLNSLDAAVPWLFVIAGFIVFEPIARAAIDNRPRPPTRRILVRGAVQLLPVYLVAVVVVWFLRQPSLPGDWRDLLEHLTFTQVFDEKRIFYTIGPAWAISVGVLTGLLLLGLGIGLARICQVLSGRMERIVASCSITAVLALISLGWKAWSYAGRNRPTDGSFTTWFGPLASLDNVAIGMAVAIVVAAARSGRPLGQRGRWALRTAAGMTLVVAFVIREPNSWTAVYFSTLCSIGFGCLIASTVLSTGRGERRKLDPLRRPLPWIGTISLSIYLWHEPLMLTLRPWGLVRQAPEAFGRDVLVVVVVSILAGWLSHAALERPVRRLGEMVDRRTWPG